MPRKRSGHSDDWGYGYYESRPRLPADGIRAKNKSGAFGTSWWAKRWISVLESFNFGSRLTRGRTYARGGAVLNIDITVGWVNSRVQGSRPTPYTVKIGIQPLSDTQWQQAIAAMSEQAIFAAQLLSGEMPQEIEQAFESAKVALFPMKSSELSTSCSCPDYANPCKHIAAVYYLLGERFDEDPFLIFELRGRNKDAIITALRELRAGSLPTQPEIAVPVCEPEPALADLLSCYDDPGTDLAQINTQIAAPDVKAAILKRYGTAPAGTQTHLSALYQTISQRMLARLFTDAG
ncbi:SWIM zinc finger family protein [Candidatus Oscillochloris fontis]|uniref:SWIM zinc finger family protein n=1 Tax=Candidatus Oscillochloris fontis TaxID=2496868 RepID=UPI00101D1DEB|nr:SWIM zinc finger family protein [Candidatus Oscillochloris fontis]